MTRTDLSPDVPVAVQKTYEVLMEHLRRLLTLERVSELLSWDQETVMPPGGAPARAEHAAAVEVAAHGLRANPRMAEWLATLNAEKARLGDVARVNIREADRIHYRAVRIPESLAAAIARATSHGQVIWAATRRANCFSDFAPVLTEIVVRTSHQPLQRHPDGAAPWKWFDLMYGFWPECTSRNHPMMAPASTVSALRTLIDALSLPLGAICRIAN
jgi:Zn-dependent M32 family carboxypeptidase